MIFSMHKILAFKLLLAALIGCAACGPPSGDWSGSSPDPPPELTEDAIREGVNDNRVFDVPSEDGVGDPISWGFDEDEPKEVKIIERVDEGTQATIVLEITTRSSPRSREPKALSGRIKTFWKVETGWAIRGWQIERMDNISMTYKKLPKPAEPDVNANRQ